MGFTGRVITGTALTCVGLVILIAGGLGTGVLAAAAGAALLISAYRRLHHD